jgi:LPS sulfotransferase NodH
LKTTEEKLYEVFSNLDRRPDFPVEKIRKKIAIVSTPRCGSTMFCDTLKNTGMMGFPKEWINMRYILAYSQYFNTKNIDLDQYLDFIYRKTTSSNGIFSINFHVEQHIEMLKHKFDVFSLNFDKSYYLYRKEKIDQAYSLARASISDQWSASTKASHEIEGDIGHNKILQALIHICDSEKYYEQNIKSSIDNEYYYEDFSLLKSTNAFSEIFEDLELDIPTTTLSTSMKKQSEKEGSLELKQFKKYLSSAANW